MLALSRRLDESIQIDGGIQIKVLEIRGNRVRLGIEAPKAIGIRRSELNRDERPPQRNTKG